MVDHELAELRRLIARLRSQVNSIRTGDPALRRVVNDVERLEIDVAELVGAPPRTEAAVVMVPDTPYDPTFWRDADDEGIGGHRWSDHG